MKNIVVIGASGEVGRGIVEVLLARGHRVAAVARAAERLGFLGARPNLHIIQGSLESDATAAKLRDTICTTLPSIDGVVVCVNGPRATADILTHTSEAFAALVFQDLVTHFTAARVLIPAQAPGGVYIGIGGGSADFILDGGVHLSAAQAGLRMLYRGLAHEVEGKVVKELTVASVVNSVSTRAFADPVWVTEMEVGEQVAAMLEDPAAFPAPVWRMARRDASGRPVITADPPTRVQGLRQAKEAT